MIEIVIEIEIIIEITEMMIIAEEVITEAIKGIIEGVTIGLMPDGIEVIGIEAVTGEFKLAFLCLGQKIVLSSITPKYQRFFFRFSALRV